MAAYCRSATVIDHGARLSNLPTLNIAASAIADESGELAAVERLSDRLPPRTVDEVAIDTYVTALSEVLDLDRWARAIGAPAQSSRRVFRLAQGPPPRACRPSDE